MEIERRPLHQWFVGIAGLIWMVLGVVDYLLVILRSPSYLDLLGPTQVAFLAGYGPMAQALWAIAVCMGLAGALALLTREAWAAMALAVAFFATLGQASWLLLLSEPPLLALLGSLGAAQILVTLSVTLLMWLYARQSIPASA